MKDQETEKQWESKDKGEELRAIYLDEVASSVIDLLQQVWVTQADHVGSNAYCIPVLAMQLLMRLDLGAPPVIQQAPYVRELGPERARDRSQG